MNRKIFIVLLFLSISIFIKAQDYNTGIGLRAGLANGITVKHFINDINAVEGILDSRWRGFSFTGLYEFQKPAFDVVGLYWFYGFGGHIGFWNGGNVNWVGDSGDYTVIGIDGILGLEYNFIEIPINISVDWKPAINIIGHSGFWGDGGAISIRYIF